MLLFFVAAMVGYMLATRSVSKQLRAAADAAAKLAGLAPEEVAAWRRSPGAGKQPGTPAKATKTEQEMDADALSLDETRDLLRLHRRAKERWEQARAPSRAAAAEADLGASALGRAATSNAPASNTPASRRLASKAVVQTAYVDYLETALLVSDAEKRLQHAIATQRRVAPRQKPLLEALAKSTSASLDSVRSQRHGRVTLETVLYGGEAQPRGLQPLPPPPPPTGAMPAR